MVNSLLFVTNTNRFSEYGSMNSFRIPTGPLPSPATTIQRISINKELSRVAESVLYSPWTLFVCKLVIGLVSAYDIHQTVKYVECLPQMELNPVGRWLMNLDDGPGCHLQETACFITAKFAGNFICLAVLELLSKWRSHVAIGVAVPVAGFQLWLLYFLIFGQA